jgi:SAM-dependent methyltransferase
LARGLAARGAIVAGVDVSPEQIACARRLAPAIDFHVSPAERTPFADASFDAVTANQCWLYFDAPRAIAEARRVVVAGGVLVTSHLSWLPREDPVAASTEALVLSHNPHWSAGDWDGHVPAHPQWARALRLRSSFVYDERIEFTRETWRGRIRACRGVGASMSAEEVARFDADHDALLRRIAPERFDVLHRIDAHVFEL